MNTKRKIEQCHEEDIANDLSGPSYLDDDLRAQVLEAAKSGTQYIIDTIEHQYRQQHGVSVVPSSIRQPLRAKAYLMYAGYCEQMAQDLRIAAKNPETKL